MQPEIATSEAPRAPGKAERALLAQLQDAVDPFCATEKGELPAGVRDGAFDVLQARDVQTALNALAVMLDAAQAAERVVRARVARIAARLELQVEQARQLTASIAGKLQTGLQESGAPLATIPGDAIQLKSGAPSVFITDKSLLTPQYLRQPKIPDPEPDKVKIKKAIAAGIAVPGAVLKNGEPTLVWIGRKEAAA